MIPDLVIFDLDGTLVDSKEDIATAVNLTLRELGLRERPREEIFDFIGEGARRLVERAVAPRSELAEAGLAAWRRHYGAHLADTTRLYPGVAAALARARCQLAVHTNKPGDFARRILAALGVGERFRAVLGGDEGARKPDPEGALRLVRDAGAAPARTLFVGDSAVDVQTARAARLPFLAVAWGIRPREELAAAGATTFAESPVELGAWLAGERELPPPP